MKYIRILAFLPFFIQLSAQDKEDVKIERQIDKLFDGMRAGDSSSIRILFAETAIISTVQRDHNGKTGKRSSTVEGFIRAVGTPHSEIWDEKIWSVDIKIDGDLAVAWTEYTFYLGKQMSHCGVNVFEFVNSQGDWKISAITDTRRKENCRTDPHTEINNILDNWHQAAGKGDEENFFGSMSEDAIYIGTDATERWTRDELRTWSKEYFDRDTAWSFTPMSRNIHVDSSEQLAWFDELLDTWMGTCRASGVLEKQVDKWRIKHYHLSIAVPNEQVDSYLKLIGRK